MTKAELFRRLWEAYTRLETLSEVPAKSYQGTIISQGGQGSRPPQRVSGSYPYFLHKLNVLVEQAEREYQKVTRTPKVKMESVNDFRRRIIVQYDGWSARDVADAERVSERYVNQIRQAWEDAKAA